MNCIREMRKLLSRINIELSSKIMYRCFVHKKLNLDNPRTFNEKICWLKLYEFPKEQKVIDCADKYKMRKIVSDKGYSNLLVGLIGVWERPEDIEWDLLPNKFVLKCNHGCSYNIICNDKSKIEKRKVIKKLKKWLKEDFGLVSGEPHYSRIDRRIICEEFLEGNLKDYKFFCFNGIPKFYYVASVPNGILHNMVCDFFYPDGKIADFYRLDHNRFAETPEIPQNLHEMLTIAKELSKNFPFVRVDLMAVGKKIYFSEFTFTPSAGIMPLAPDGADEKIGEWLDLECYR